MSDSSKPIQSKLEFASRIFADTFTKKKKKKKEGACPTHLRRGKPISSRLGETSRGYFRRLSDGDKPMPGHDRSLSGTQKTGCVIPWKLFLTCSHPGRARHSWHPTYITDISFPFSHSIYRVHLPRIGIRVTTSAGYITGILGSAFSRRNVKTYLRESLKSRKFAISRRRLFAIFFARKYLIDSEIAIHIWFRNIFVFFRILHMRHIVTDGSEMFYIVFPLSVLQIFYPFFISKMEVTFVFFQRKNNNGYKKLKTFFLINSI